jgi:hypothetical protein
MLTVTTAILPSAQKLQPLGEKSSPDLLSDMHTRKFDPFRATFDLFMQGKPLGWAQKPTMYENVTHIQIQHKSMYSQIARSP